MKQKLDEMIKAGKLARVDVPTDWCLNMSVTERVKPDSSIKVRLCLDPSQTINKAIQVPKYTAPTLDEIMPRLSCKKKSRYSTMMQSP